MRASRLVVLTSGAAALGMATAVGWGAADAAAAEGPFRAFVGSWHGTGEVVGSNGEHERIRCRADYSEGKGGAALTQTIVCASPSYKMDIRSYAEASGGNVQGDWSESTRNITGHLTGHIADGRFEGAVQGPGFSAGISLTANGRSQAVNISPQGGDISNVSIELVRGS